MPVISAKYYDIMAVKWFFKQMGAVRVNDLETGSRDTQVLKSIKRAVFKGLRRNNNIVLYPGGQLAGQGYERIQNKKSAFHIVNSIPDNVLIVGVRISGLWGSIFSKAKTGKTPDLFQQLMKALFYTAANLLVFVPKRPVSIEFTDLTAAAKNMTGEGQKQFNGFLEEFYNHNGEEPKVVLKHFFFLPKSKQIHAGPLVKSTKLEVEE